MSELYTEYREHLDRRQKRFERFWRLRYLWLALLILMLAWIATMMGIAGTVTAVHAKTLEVRYGETFSAAVETVFGRDGGFVYRAVGAAAWTDEAPRTAGKWQARPYGLTIAGQRHYGKPIDFDIVPTGMTVSVDDEPLYYGETPEFLPTGLQYEDVLRVDSFSAVQTTYGIVQITLDPEDVHIFSASGEDVTASYRIETQGCDVVDLARRITISTESGVFVYDGAPHTAPIASIGEMGLAEGHRLVADPIYRTERGSMPNALENVRIVADDGTDVTNRYRILYDYGTLTVEPRPLTVKTPTYSLTYDGSEHTDTSYEITEGNLAAEQSISLEWRDYAEGKFTVKNAGVYRNEPVVTIRDAAGEDVTENYAITPDFGVVTVDRLGIAVSTPSDDFVYDGKWHSYTTYRLTDGDLARGHALGLTDTLSVRDADTYQNEPVVTIRDAAGEDVTENYAIERAFGVVTIDRRPITVRTETATFVYDGTVHSYTGTLVGDLAADHTIAYENTLSARDADTYRNTLEAALRTAAGEDVTDNYEITYEFGTVTIERIAVTVTTRSDTRTYDGASHEYNDGTITDGEPVAGDRLVRLSPLTVKDARSYPNESEWKIQTAEGEDVTKNYAITPDLGTVTIDRRPVTITTESDTRTYDGATHTFDGYTVGTETPLVGGHSVRLSAVLSVLGFGSYPNRPTIDICDENGETVTDNYDLTPVYGTVTVNKRRVTFTAAAAYPDGYTVTYDGTPKQLRAEDWSPDPTGGLVGGHRYAPEFQPLTTICIEPNYKPSRDVILDAGGTDVTDNYEITVVPLRFMILPRDVKVTSGDGTSVYDGQPHGNASYTDDNLVEGHRIEAVYPTFVEAGTHENIMESPRIVDANGEDVTANYTPAYVPGIIEIEKRSVLLSTPSRQWTYDADPHSEEGISPIGTALVDGHAVRNADRSAPRFPSVVAVSDSKQNEIEGYAALRIFDADGTGEDVTDNYVLSWQFGTLTVAPRPLTVTSDSKEWVYDGDPHSETGYTVSGLVASAAHTHSYSATPRIGYDPLENVTDGAQNKLYYDAERITDESGADVTANYAIDNTRYGVLTITRRKLGIETASRNLGVYDAQPHELHEYTPDWGDADAQLRQKFTIDPIWLSADNFVSAGRHRNDVEVRIYKGDADVTDNFDLSYTFGEVTIDRRQVSFETASERWTYDGAAHRSAAFDSEDSALQLVAGHSVRKPDGTAPGESDYASVTDVWDDGQNLLYGAETFRIFDETESDVTDNYILVWSYGTIGIDPRPIEFRRDAESFVYDGEEHDYGTRATLGDPAQLVGGESFAFENAVFVHVGDHETPTVTIRKADGTDGTRNYRIVNNTQAVTITRRIVRVRIAPDEDKGESADLIYDGTDHRLTKWVFEDGTLAGEHRIDAIYPVYRAVRGIGGAETDLYRPTGCKIADALGREIDQWATDYDIEWGDGSLVIRKRTVRASIGADESKGESAVLTFDGMPHRLSKWTVAPDGEGLASGHRIENDDLTFVHVNMQGGVASAYTYLPSGIRIVDGDGADVTANYEHTFDAGSLTILRLKLTIELIADSEKDESASVEYDGKAHRLTKWDGEETLVSDHRVGAQLPSYVDVMLPTEFAPTEDPVIVTAAGIEAEQWRTDYDITWVYTTLEITVRRVTLATESRQWTYDAQPHTWDGWSAQDNALAEGHDLRWKSQSDIETVGETDNEFYDVTVVDALGADVTSNYALTWVRGRLSVIRRNVRFCTGSQSFEYDGQEHDFGDTSAFVIEREMGASGLLDGHDVRFTPQGPLPTVRTVGQDHVRNEFDFDVVITDDSGAVVTENYQIEKTYGEIFVTPTDLAVTTPSREWVYDGVPHAVTEGSAYRFGQLVSGDGIVGDPVVDPDRATTVETVLEGDVFNLTECRIVVRNAAGKDVSDCYRLVYTPGKLSISRRRIDVTTPDDETVYNGSAQSCGKPASVDWVTGEQGEWDYAAFRVEAQYLSYRDADSYPNEFLGDPRVWRGGEDVSANFELTRIETGTFTIRTRLIRIRGGEAVFVYDKDNTDSCFIGGEYVPPEPGAQDEGLVYGHYIEMGYAPVREITDDTEARYRECRLSTFAIFDGEGLYAENVTSNYTLEEQPGRIRVKAPITVELSPCKITYKGTPLAYNSICAEVVGCPVDVEPDDIEIAFAASPKFVDVGEYGLSDILECCTVTLATGGLLYDGAAGDGQPDPANRVDFTPVGESLLVINQIILEIKMQSYIAENRGMELTWNIEEMGEPYIFRRGKLASGHRLVYELDGGLAPDESYRSNCFASYRIVDATDTDVTSNYNVSFVPGVLAWKGAEVPEEYL